MKTIAFLMISALMLAMTSFCGCQQKETIMTPSNTVSPIIIGQDVLYGAGREGFVRQNLIIRDNGTWQNFVNHMNINNNVSETFIETEIKFSEYMIIAVFDEVKSNGGWSIDITNIEQQANRISITVTNLKTGNASSVITQPYQIVKIPVSDKEIVFETSYK